MHRLNIVWVTVVAFVLTGCGGDSRLLTVPVSGKVVMDGKPMEAASVTFVPDGKETRSANGDTDANGEFVLSTYDDGDGAVPGDYRVMIVQMKANPKFAAQVEGVSANEMYMKVMSGQATPNVSTGVVPIKYYSEKTSGLRRSVSSEGENIFTFDLKP